MKFLSYLERWNTSFSTVCDVYYIYRHPGANAANVIDRRKEAASLRAAKKLGIDGTLVYIDEAEGWKISRFIDTKEEFDFSNHDHVRLLAASLKTLHDARIRVGFSFDYAAEADRLIDRIRHMDGLAYSELVHSRDLMAVVFDLLKRDPWQVSLCHNDLYPPNLLIKGEELHLIDWEFAGDSDIGFDICKLFAVANPASPEERDRFLSYYYGRPVTQAEVLHLYACAAVQYYYWFVWSIYAGKISGTTPELMVEWYDKMNQYRDRVVGLLDAPPAQETL